MTSVLQNRESDWDRLVDAWKKMFGDKDLVTVDRRIKSGLILPILLRGSGKYRKSGPKLRESIREYEVRIPKTEVLKQFILIDELGR